MTKIFFDPQQLDETDGLVDTDLARELRIQAARRDITERRRITQRLRQALAAGGLALYYQPQIHLGSGRVRKAEAMLRLLHRRRGLIPPSHFMPVAERSEVIHEIGGWSLHAACKEAANWPAQLAVALSLSRRQIQSAKLIKYLIEALSRSGLAADRLELELTESMLNDENEDTMFNLRAIRGLGVHMAVSNFGAGYASLNILKRLPPNTLKLDRALTRDIGEDDETTGILHAAIEAGHALGCVVLADGIETAGQSKILTEIGCDEGQGSYFGPPRSAEAFRQHLY